MNKERYIIIALIIIFFAYFIGTNNSTPIVSNNHYSLTRPAEIIATPKDTVYLRYKDPTNKAIKIYIKEPGDSSLLKDLAIQIDSLNKILDYHKIDRIATLDTTFKPYYDRLLIYHSLVSNSWDMSIFYAERKIKDSITTIFIPTVKKYNNDFEKFVAESPYLSIASSLIIAYSFGKLK